MIIIETCPKCGHDLVDEVIELFIELNATDEQLDFPVVYASAKNGIVFNANVLLPAPPLYEKQEITLQLAILLPQFNFILYYFYFL